MSWKFKVVNLLLKEKKKGLDVLRGLSQSLEIYWEIYWETHSTINRGARSNFLLFAWLKTRKSKCFVHMLGAKWI